MGNIVGENFDDYVINQVKKRQEILGSINKTNEQLVWENSKTSWVKLVSSSDLINNDKDFLPSFINTGYIGGSKLAERFILFNGVTNEIPKILPGIETIQRSGIGLNNPWSGNNVYGLGGSEFGIQPMPGIISANIKTETRGTLKTGTVNIKANNREQFDIISTLYLRLGYMMLLEWGNNCYYDNNGNFISDNKLSLADAFLSKKYNSNITSQLGEKVTYNNLLQAVEIQRKESCGNYDALVGKVVNYNWTFNRDGSYDIIIIIRSIGDVIESLKTNILLPGETVSTSINNSTQPPGAKDSYSIIKAYAENNTIAQHFSKILDIFKFENADEIQNLSVNFQGTTTYKNRENTVNYFSQVYDNSSSNSNTAQYFIRLGEFLTFLETSIIPEVKNSGKLINFDINKDDNLIYSPPNQISSDPRICAFRKKINTYSIPSGANTNTFEFYPTIEDFTGGKLMNVYFNMVYILDVLNKLKDKDGKIILIEFLNAIMTGFCKATGNYNEITTRVNIENNKIIFIDSTTYPNRSLKNPNTVNFNVYGISPSKEGSFIRDLQLKTGITPDLATMITIGSTATGYVTGQDATLLSNLNKGTQDRIKPEVQSPISTKRESEENNKPIIDVYTESQKAFDQFIINSIPNLKENNSGISSNYPNWNEDLYSNFTNTQVQLLEYDQSQSTNNIRLKLDKTNPYASSPTNGFLPFDLNLTMDGLSGMKIYQKYTIDSKFLPSNYPQAMEFIIKGVSNTIQNNIWTTNIESLAIPKNPTSIQPPQPITNNSTRASVTLYRGSEQITENETLAFLRDVLKGLGISNPNNNQVEFMKIWRQMEGAKATWNPFNTTRVLPGSLPYSETSTPGVFVQNYIDRNQGLQGTILTLKEPEFSPILQSIKQITTDKNTISNTMLVVNNTPAWGTKFNPPIYTFYKTLSNKIWKTPVIYFNPNV